MKKYYVLLLLTMPCCKAMLEAPETHETIINPMNKTASSRLSAEVDAETASINSGASYNIKANNKFQPISTDYGTSSTTSPQSIVMATMPKVEMSANHDDQFSNTSDATPPLEFFDINNLPNTFDANPEETQSTSTPDNFVPLTAQNLKSGNNTQQPTLWNQATTKMQQGLDYITGTTRNADGSIKVKNLNGTYTTTYQPDAQGNVTQITSNGKSQTKIVRDKTGKTISIQNVVRKNTNNNEQPETTYTSSTITPTSITHFIETSPKQNKGQTIFEESVNLETKTSSKKSLATPPNKPGKFGQNITTENINSAQIFEKIQNFRYPQEVTSFLDNILQSLRLLPTKEYLQMKTKALASWRPNMSLPDFTAWIAPIKQFFTQQKAPTISYDPLTGEIISDAQTPTALPKDPNASTLSFADANEINKSVRPSSPSTSTENYNLSPVKKINNMTTKTPLTQPKQDGRVTYEPTHVIHDPKNEAYLYTGQAKPKPPLEQLMNDILTSPKNKNTNIKILFDQTLLNNNLYTEYTQLSPTTAQQIFNSFVADVNVAKTPADLQTAQSNALKNAQNIIFLSDEGNQIFYKKQI